MSYWLRDSGKRTKPQHSGHLLPRVSPPRPRNGGTPAVDQGTPAKLKAASSGRDAALVTEQTRDNFAFGTFVEVAGKHDRTDLEAQIADEEQ